MILEAESLRPQLRCVRARPSWHRCTSYSKDFEGLQVQLKGNLSYDKLHACNVNLRCIARTCVHRQEDKQPETTGVEQVF